MDTVIIRNHKAFAKGEEEIEINSLLPYLNSLIEIEENVIFDDIWKLIENDWEIYNTIFQQALGCFDLQIYIKQFKKPYKDKDRDPENRMERLECYWAADLDTYKNKVSFALTPCLHGWGPQISPTASGEDIKIEGGWSLSFTPINGYKGFKFSLNRKYQLSHVDLDKPIVKDIEDKKVRSGFSVLFKEVETDWTVYDMLYAILDEISWMGTPDNQEKQFNKLSETIQGVKDGSIPTYPLENLRDMLSVKKNITGDDVIE